VAVTLDDDEFAAYKGAEMRGVEYLDREKLELEMADMDRFTEECQRVFQDGIDTERVDFKYDFYDTKLNDDEFQAFLQDRAAAGDGYAVMLLGDGPEAPYECVCGSRERKHLCKRQINIADLPRPIQDKARKRLRSGWLVAPSVISKETHGDQEPNSTQPDISVLEKPSPTSVATATKESKETKVDAAETKESKAVVVTPPAALQPQTYPPGFSQDFRAAAPEPSPQVTAQPAVAPKAPLEEQKEKPEAPQEAKAEVSKKVPPKPLTKEEKARRNKERKQRKR